MSPDPATPSGTTVAVTDGVLELGADGAIRLLGGSCAACGRPHFPAADSCPWCGSDGIEPAPLSSDATLWAWTAVTAAPPGYDGPVPYGFGVVELPDGIRIVTRLTEPDPARLAHGMPMRLTVDVVAVDDTGRDVVAWSFAPSRESR